MTDARYVDLKYDVLSFKALGNGKSGEYEAIVAAFGNVDRYREVLVSGSLDESIALALPPVVWSHDWLTPPIGTTSEMAELDRAAVEKLIKKSLPEDVLGGLYAKASLFVEDVPLAKHIYTAMSNKNGDGGAALSQFSVGMNVVKESYERRDNDVVVTLLEKCDLVEHGPCLKGINPATYNINTKAASDIKRLITKGLITPDDVRAAIGLPPVGEPDDKPIEKAERDPEMQRRLVDLLLA